MALPLKLSIAVSFSLSYAMSLIRATRCVLRRRNNVAYFHPSPAWLAARKVLQQFKLADIGEGITECEVIKWYDSQLHERLSTRYSVHGPNRQRQREGDADEEHAFSIVWLCFVLHHSDARASPAGMYPLSLPSVPLMRSAKSRATKQASKLRARSTALSRRSSCRKGR